MTDFMHFLPGYLSSILPEYLPEYRVVLRGLFAWGCHSGAKCASPDLFCQRALGAQWEWLWPLALQLVV